MIKIAVCDDDKIFADSLSKSIRICFQNAYMACSVNTFYSARDLYSSLEAKYYDLLFLDIEIGNDSGIDLANRIRDELNNSKTVIVYVSNYSRYHDNRQLYRAAPVSFISKPVKNDDIEQVVEIVSRRVSRSDSPDDYFTYSFKSEKHLLLKRDIYYFECSGRNMVAVTKEGRATFILTMEEVQQQAAESYFVMIHRSFLVNILHLKSYNSQHAIMLNGDSIPISDRHRKEATWAIADFFNKRVRENIHA